MSGAYLPWLARTPHDRGDGARLVPVCHGRHQAATYEAVMTMSMRVCSKPGCPTLIPQGQSRCTPHKREADKARGTRQERGYDAEHDAERRRWLDIIDGGAAVYCARGCGRRIRYGDPFDLGHNDKRTAWTGPECEHCNRSAGGRLAHPHLKA